MNTRQTRIIVIFTSMVAMVVYQLTKPVLLPFLGLVISLNILFNKDFVWALQERGSARFGYRLGTRTATWETWTTVGGGVLFVLVAWVIMLAV
jgi:hypothetical protein